MGCETAERHVRVRPVRRRACRRRHGPFLRPCRKRCRVRVVDRHGTRRRSDESCELGVYERRGQCDRGRTPLIAHDCVLRWRRLGAGAVRLQPRPVQMRREGLYAHGGQRHARLRTDRNRERLHVEPERTQAPYHGSRRHGNDRRERHGPRPFARPHGVRQQPRDVCQHVLERISVGRHPFQQQLCASQHGQHQAHHPVGGQSSACRGLRHAHASDREHVQDVLRADGRRTGQMSEGLGILRLERQ